MNFSHFAFEEPSLLTVSCGYPVRVAFALHLSADRSATYSRIGENFCDAAFGGRMKRWLLAGTLALAAGGQGLASDLPPPAVPPAPRAPAAYIPPPVSPV